MVSLTPLSIEDLERRKMPKKINLPVEEIISEYQSGLSTIQLGEKYGVSKSIINNRLRENGVKIRPPRNMKRVDLPMEEIISYYQSGLSTIQLEEKYGVSHTTIGKKLRENGVKLRPSRSMKRIYIPIEEIISYYESGMALIQLAEKYGVSKNIINNRLRENGVELRPSRSKIKLPIEEIISYYQSGMTLIQLAEKYGVNHNVIHNRLRENGVELRTNKIKLPIEEIISEYESGMNLTKLAEKYGVSTATIHRRLKKNGVK